MQKWQDTGIIVFANKFGEDNIVLGIFTVSHGFAKGVIKRTTKAYKAGAYQIGNLVEVTWQARLEEHLGNFNIDLLEAYTSRIMNNPCLLEGEQAACGEVSLCLPEKEPYPELYPIFSMLLKEGALKDELNWAAQFVLWEKELLSQLGFALDLEKCALTGTKENLAYVSPITGRAANVDAAFIWKDKLLKLPPFMRETSKGIQDLNITYDDVLDGLALTGHFLKNFAFPPERTIFSRERFIGKIREKANSHR